MPIAFDPDAKGVWSLESDRKKPAAGRPVFIVKFLTDRQCDRLSEMRDALDAAQGQITDAEFWQRYWEIIVFGVTGWRNMPWAAAGLPEQASFTLDNLRCMLIPRELYELARSYHLGVELDEGDVKNSPTPQSPPSPEAPAAAAVTPEPAAV
jgi:hypothetical protein